MKVHCLLMWIKMHKRIRMCKCLQNRVATVLGTVYFRNALPTGFFV